MKIRAAPLLLWMVCCAACSNPVKHCTLNSECQPAICDRGFCVVDSDAGAGGGGGGGNTDGGVDGGDAGADGGDPLVIEVLPAAPPTRGSSLNVIAEDPFLGATAWKRDESLTIQVRSNKPLLAAPSLRASSPLRDGGVSAFSTNGVAQSAQLCCADGGSGSTCFCFDVSLPLVPFEAFNGSVRFEARGDSDAGMAVSPAAGVRVTRWRWSSQILQATDTARAPAIDFAGRVLVGGQSDPTNGRVVSVLPDGEIAWQVVGGAVTAPIAAARFEKGGVYAPRRTAGGAHVERLDGEAGAPLSSCSPTPDFTILSAISVNQFPPGPSDLVIAIAEDTTGHRLLGHRPSDGFCYAEPTTSIGTPGSRATAASKGALLVYGTTANAMFAREVTGDGGMRVLPPYPVTAPAQLGFILTSGGVAIGAGAVADAGAIFRVFTATGVSTWLWSDGGIGTPGQIVLGVDDHVFFGESGSKLHRITIGTSSPVSIPTAGPIVGAPLIGADGGIVYAVTTTGVVHAVNALTMEPLWTMPRPPGNPVFDTSPTIDCARKGSAITNGPGTLYVMGRATGSLYALIVDSNGLDSRAPWPKFQYDVRNSGFPDGVATPSCP